MFFASSGVFAFYDENHTLSVGQEIPLVYLFFIAVAPPDASMHTIALTSVT